MRTEKQKMLAGAPYRADDAQLVADRARAVAWMDRYNASATLSDHDRLFLLREAFAEAGEGAVVRPPFFCDYGFNIRLGRGVFLNFSCVVLDVVAVVIEDGAQIGPGAQILAADHPRDPDQRRAMLEWGRPVRIGRNVWIGGGALILPGVTVGDDAIVGAGAVVTRDVAPGVRVAGNPARSLR